MDVSIIIVNYNTKELTRTCINSVFSKSLGIDFEIILVDNASTDGSREFFIKDSRILFVPLSENLGFGRANNEGFKRATGKYVLCLNPDTLLLNNAIGILRDFMEHHSDVGICGGNLYDADMKPAHSFRMSLPSLWWEFDWHFGCFLGKLLWGRNLEFNHTDKPRRVGYITGADMMVRKEILDKVGGFSRLFFMYYEECELTYRVRKLGYKVFSVPAARIQHLEGKSFPSSELTTKAKYQIFSRWMYRRLCSPHSVYKALSVFTRAKRLICRRKHALLEYQCEVINQIEELVK